MASTPLGMTRRRALAVTALALTLSHPGHRATAQGTGAGPQQVVVDLQDALLEAMRAGDAWNFERRYDFLAAAVRDSHDLLRIARIAAGSAWRTMDTGQKRRFVQLFAELSVAAYAAQFKSFSGQRFERLENTVAGDQATVHTQLLPANGEPVSLDYVLQWDGDGWRIVNVVANGVSELAIRRSQFSAVARREGIDALFDKLRESIDNYRTG